MMSVAGAWFFLMACEMFVLGNRDLRLPGLGSYSANRGQCGRHAGRSLWGVGGMIAVIVLMDQLIWRPIIAWSEKFKFEQVEAAADAALTGARLLRRSRLLSRRWPRFVDTGARSPDSALRRAPRGGSPRRHTGSREMDGASGLSIAALAGILYAMGKMAAMLAALSRPEVHEHFPGSGRHISARRVDAAAGRPLDRPGRSFRGAAAEACRDRSTHRPDRGFGAGDGAVPGRAAGPDSRRRRSGMSAPSSCCCWERNGTFCLTSSPARALFRPISKKSATSSTLAGSQRWRQPDSAGDFSLPDHRLRHRIRRRLERQHRGGIFAFSETDLFDHRPGRGHQPGYRGR